LTCRRELHRHGRQYQKASRKAVGAALAAGRPRDEVIVATKVRDALGPALNQVGLTRAHIFASVDESRVASAGFHR
jgi:aryl-alcohol dehydrogenase-like predicted oxidoreductase